jgi:hypothetical protein
MLRAFVSKWGGGGYETLVTLKTCTKRKRDTAFPHHSNPRGVPHHLLVVIQPYITSPLTFIAYRYILHIDAQPYLSI